MQTEAYETLRAVLDDYAHGDYATLALEGCEGGLESIYACFIFNSQREKARYNLFVCLDDESVAIDGEFAAMVPEERLRTVGRLVRAWNVRCLERTRAGRYAVDADGTLSFHLEREADGEVDEDLIRRSVLTVGMALDDVFRELMAALYGDTCTFVIN